LFFNFVVFSFFQPVFLSVTLPPTHVPQSEPAKPSIFFLPSHLSLSKQQVSALSTADEESLSYAAGPLGAGSAGEGEEGSDLPDLIRAEEGGGDARVLSFITLHMANLEEREEREAGRKGSINSSAAAAAPPSFPSSDPSSSSAASAASASPPGHVRPTFAAEEVLSLFPFSLDKFQERAFRFVLQGESVVVCAPTGAGKTAIAEASSSAMLATGRRVIYTTPLKALSNQKLYELREKFGAERIGLQTGDVSLNADAQITVMTTEVLRNILYRNMEEEGARLAEESSNNGSLSSSSSSSLPSGGVGETAAAAAAAAGEGEGEGQSIDEGLVRGTAAARLRDVGLIVLDEVHYLSDPDR
jgi:hypothetical protein